MKTKYLSIIAALNLLAVNLSAQSAHKGFYYPEKIHFEAERNTYSPGDTICFKASLDCGSDGSNPDPSNYLYAELLKDSVVSRVKIKRSNSGFNGYLVIPQEISPGRYSIRAYTRWNLNSGLADIYHSFIYIGNTGGANITDSVSKTGSSEQEKLLDTDIKYQREYTQSIHIMVVPVFGKMQDKYSLEVVAPDINLLIKKESLTSNSILIDGLDFPEGTKFYIQITSKRNNLAPRWYGDIFAGYYNYGGLKGEPRRGDPISMPHKKDSIREYTLKEITVREKSLYRPYYNPSPFNQTFERRQVKERNELKKFDNISVIDYILSNYNGFMLNNGKIESVRRSTIPRLNNSESTDTNDDVGRKWEPLLFINGVKCESTSELTGISVMDVESLIVLKGNEGALYNTTLGVILISLRRGGVEKAPASVKKTNLIKIEPLGWQRPL